MMNEYNINDYLRDDTELQKAVIQELLNELKRLEKEFEQYKKSKQASYESMQTEWNNAINKNREYKQALEDIREILCYGRTFYDGYFNSDKLSRTDEAIKRVNEVLK